MMGFPALRPHQGQQIESLFEQAQLDADPEARAILAGQQPTLDNVEYNSTNQP